AARLHVARTVCRRAERRLVQFAQDRPVAVTMLTYLNRLSDWLFVQARLANAQAGVADIPWSAKCRIHKQKGYNLWPFASPHLHAALLMLGLKPGEPVHYSEALGKWLPPHGPPLSLSVEFEKDGKAVTLPAWRLMREIKSKREMPPTTWIFAGSRVLDNGVYA